MTTLNSKVRPNILFILIDDLGYRDLACYGSDFYETPNLDKLSTRGIRFTNAYAAAPICSPTRASILTGKSPARLGMTQWLGGRSEGKLMDVPYIDHLSKEHTTIATALRDEGYSTWHVGKWHLGKHGEERKEYFPEKHGFDINIGGCEWGQPKNGYFAPWGLDNLSEGNEGEYLTDRLTDEAINLIKNADSKPWFMHLSHYAVHTPLQCHESLIEKYRRKAERLGRSEANSFKVGEHFPCIHKRDERVVRRIVQSDPVYAAMVENLDWNVGRTIDALIETDQFDNTLIVFYSDNGGLATSEGSPTCNAPLSEGKGWLSDGGTREPLIVCWPREISSNRLCHEPVTSMDFFPTFLEALDLPLMPECHIDGESIIKALYGDENYEHGPLFWHYPHYSNQGSVPGSSIRDKEWKLIKSYEYNTLELYNLENDISESMDLSKQYPDIVNNLHDQLLNWQQEVEAVIPDLNPNYRGF